MTELDQHLDSILKASGSGLKNYSMQKTTDDMRNALKAAIAAERETCAKVCETHGVHPALNVWNGGPDWYKHGKNCAAAIRARGEQT